MQYIDVMQSVKQSLFSSMKYFIVDKIGILIGVVSLLNFEVRGMTTTTYNATPATNLYGASYHIM